MLAHVARCGPMSMNQPTSSSRRSPPTIRRCAPCPGSLRPFIDSPAVVVSCRRGATGTGHRRERGSALDRGADDELNAPSPVDARRTGRQRDSVRSGMSIRREKQPRDAVAARTRCPVMREALRRRGSAGVPATAATGAGGAVSVRPVSVTSLGSTSENSAGSCPRRYASTSQPRSRRARAAPRSSPRAATIGFCTTGLTGTTGLSLSARAGRARCARRQLRLLGVHLRVDVHEAERERDEHDETERRADDDGGVFLAEALARLGAAGRRLTARI